VRIHHIINSYSLGAGGAERLVRSMHVSMHNSGIESRICGLLYHQDEQLDDAESLGLSSPYSPKAIFQIRAYIKKNVRPGDVVHAHLFPSNLYVSLLKQAGFIKVPIVTTEHNTFNSRRNRCIGHIIDSILYRGFDKIFAISEGVERALIRWKPGLRGLVTTVQNGVPLVFDEFHSRDDSEKPIILSVGGLRKQKNYETMLSAMALLVDMEFEYWIAGDGEERLFLEKLSIDLGLHSKVRFFGHVADISPLLEQADIFLMASRWEGFGLAVVEAMNASLPVVASEVDGLVEVVASEPPVAVLVDPHSPASISEAILDLLRSREKRTRLGSSGFQRAELFGENRMISHYIEEYRDIFSHR
jgi:glycosyltransferase involved in cell wall biosynthesis